MFLNSFICPLEEKGKIFPGGGRKKKKKTAFNEQTQYKA